MKADKPYNITSGSPRMLLYESVDSLGQKDRIGKSRIVIGVRTISEFDSLKKIVPQNAFVG